MLAMALALVVYLRSGDVFGPPPRPSPHSWGATATVAGAPSGISFEARDGTKLRGWVFQTRKSDAPFVLYFYGSNEDAQVSTQRMAWLSTSAGVNAVVIDYRGYGFSEGAISPTAMREDAIAAFDAVRRLAPTSPILVYGRSVGAEFAIHVAASRDVAGLVLQAPPASASEMAAWSHEHDVPAVVRWAVSLKGDGTYRTTFQGAAEIASANVPLLVIHGDADQDVPLAQGREVFDASPAKKKRLLIVPGAHHNDIWISTAPVEPVLTSFFRQFDTTPN